MINKYLIIINIISFILFGIDKYNAIKHNYRISEKTLFTISILGGSIGSIIGMKVFRHKTKKNYFKYGIPIVLIIQLFLLYYITKNKEVTWKI